MILIIKGDRTGSIGKSPGQPQSATQLELPGVFRNIETLQNFYKKIQPGGPGWKKIIDKKFSKKVNQEIALSKVFIITSNFFNCISVFPKIFSKRKTDEGKED